MPHPQQTRSDRPEPTVADQLNTVLAKLRAAEHRYHRPKGSVMLLAVSKGMPIDRIAEAAACGQFHFGESYLQEALSKMETLQDMERSVATVATPLTWHFIGPIQSNKTRGIAENFAWAHSVDRYKIAQRLSEQRPEHLPPLNICLQVNISQEPQKQGIAIDQIRAIAETIAQLPRLQLRGLMAVPASCHDFQKQRIPFARLREIQQGLIADGLALDTLSMGMSGDWEAAVAEGATLVRIGTAIFGARPTHQRIAKQRND